MDSIEVLSPTLMDEMPEQLAELQTTVRKLGVPRGWHYYIDLCWAARQVAPTPGMKVLDAGAGHGVLQWWLASRGADVLSVDLETRSHPGARFEAWCRHTRRNHAGPYHGRSLRDLLPPRRYWSTQAWREKAKATFRQYFPEPPLFEGSVEYWDQDLCDLSQLESDSMDAIVSISALEHNTPENLRIVIAELERVLKPGGVMAVTTSAAPGEDWYHEPSSGWCFGEKSLAEFFGLQGYESNFDLYEQIREELIACEFLRDDLPPFYFEGGENGMPWGEWDPAYLPVGILKTKR